MLFIEGFESQPAGPQTTTDEFFEMWRDDLLNIEVPSVANGGRHFVVTGKDVERSSAHFIPGVLRTNSGINDPRIDSNRME